MANVDTVFELLKFRASKSGYGGTISSNDFNLVFPAAEVRYFNKLFGDQNKYQVGNPIPPIAYPETLKISTSLSKFGTQPIQLQIDANGQWQKPPKITDLYIDSLAHYMTGTGGSAIAKYTLSGGSGYTDGVYPNVSLTGGSGTGAKANITISGGSVTICNLTNVGNGYHVNDNLHASLAGSGTGFAVLVNTLSTTNPVPVQRVEKQDLSDNLYSFYEYPTETFPIYIEYATYIQFYPTNLGTSMLTTLRKPNATKWAYTLNGGIGNTNSLIGGSGYTNGVYPNVNLTGGTGNSAQATITVTGGAVTNVQITTQGFGYIVGDTLSGTLPAGANFSVHVASIVNGRQVYDSVNSVDPEWLDTDIDQIIYMALTDIGVYSRDMELQQFAEANSRTGGTA